MLEMLKARKEQLEAQGKKGFTLMEMLIVIAIIAILIAIAIPIFSSQLDAANKATDEANIRSGYAGAVAKAMLDNPTANTDYILKTDGSVDDSGTAYECKTGASAEVGGVSVTWTKGSSVTYTYNATTKKITISAGAGASDPAQG